MEQRKHFNKLNAEERKTISLKVVKAISSYLQLFISPIIVRRIISVLLIIAGVHSDGITELTGMSDQLMNDNIQGLFEVKSGRGRKSKIKDVEAQIIEEIEKGNYQTQQQIADMIHEKFGISVSIMAVSRLLKKTRSAS